MKLQTYKGYFENGRVILPLSVFPDSGEFSITFVEHDEADMKAKRERQREVVNRLFNPSEKDEDDTDWETFDEILKEGLKFKTPEELGL